MYPVWSQGLFIPDMILMSHFYSAKLICSTWLYCKTFVGCLYLFRIPACPGVMRWWQYGLTNNKSCQHTHVHTHIHKYIHTHTHAAESKGYAALLLCCQALQDVSPTVVRTHAAVVTHTCCTYILYVHATHPVITRTKCQNNLHRDPLPFPPFLWSNL